jgi:hypothetical protein
MAENGVKRPTKHTNLHLTNCAHIHSTEHLHDSPDFDIHSVAVDGHRKKSAGAANHRSWQKRRINRKITLSQSRGQLLAAR